VERSPDHPELDCLILVGTSRCWTTLPRGEILLGDSSYLPHFTHSVKTVLGHRDPVVLARRVGCYLQEKQGSARARLHVLFEHATELLEFSEELWYAARMDVSNFASLTFVSHEGYVSLCVPPPGDHTAFWAQFQLEPISQPRKEAERFLASFESEEIRVGDDEIYSRSPDGRKVVLCQIP
jgi:hypothetical protein